MLPSGGLFVTWASAFCAAETITRGVDHGLRGPSDGSAASDETFEPSKAGVKDDMTNETPFDAFASDTINPLTMAEGIVLRNSRGLGIDPDQVIFRFMTRLSSSRKSWSDIGLPHLSSKLCDRPHFGCGLLLCLPRA